MLKNAYLFAFNSASCLGWCFVLYQCIANIPNPENPNFTSAIKELGPILPYVQSLAVMEVVHALIGLVKSDAFTTFIQVLSRMGVVWLVLHLQSLAHVLGSKSPVPKPVDYGWCYFGCALSWSLVEVPRYMFYALNVYKISPYPLLWLRYSLFAVLYPSGITSEICSILRLRSKISPKFGSYLMPNRLNFEITFRQAVTLTLLLYVPFSPLLYKHMIDQRSKQLSLTVEDKKKAE